MSEPYEQLLEATIQQLEELKSRGVKSVILAPETLTSLHPTAPATAPSRRFTPPSQAQNLPIQISPPTSQAPPKTPSQLPGRETETIAPSKAVALPTSVSEPLDPAAKSEGMRELRERALVCVKCPNLASSRKNVVFGVGDINASLMFVGEAPGADEDAQAEPFVGAAGQLLTRIIQTMGLTRQTVYIGNILKCRPDTPGQTSGNRKPTSDEMKTCIPYLHSQIDLIQPKVLVALGATAVEGLLGKTDGITRLRGNWKTYRGIPLMPTFHPSYLLRNQALSEKRKVWEDMLRVMERLGMPVSEKQRGYFLRA